MSNQPGVGLADGPGTASELLLDTRRKNTMTVVVCFGSERLPRYKIWKVADAFERLVRPTILSFPTKHIISILSPQSLYFMWGGPHRNLSPTFIMWTAAYINGRRP